MKNKVEEIIKSFKEKNENNSSIYSDERIAEIAVNCVSLSETWHDRVRNNKVISLELALFNKDNALSQTLHGISFDNLAETMLDILVNKQDKYSKMALNYYAFEDGKKESGLIGDLEIN